MCISKGTGDACAPTGLGTPVHPQDWGRPYTHGTVGTPMHPQCTHRMGVTTVRGPVGLGAYQLDTMKALWIH